MNDGNSTAIALRPGTDMAVATQETAVSAVAAQARAMVESRYVMALRRPRNWDQVRQDILRECRRPSFAHNKSAFYRKPIGAGVEGLGIRFVEVALRCMTNVLVETTMIFEDATKEVQRVSVTDLESNLTYPLDVRVSKTVERAKPMDDGSYFAVRTNSQGKPVYTVAATDDDLLNKRAALISKAVRTLGLRVIPGDIQDEAEAIIKEVRRDEAAKDPDAERKRIADAFGEIGVKASQLEEYLGHDLSTCSPNELVDLRGIYGAIKDGEATWRQVVENKAAQDGGGGAGGDQSAGGSNPAASVSELNAKIANKKGQAAPAAKPDDCPVLSLDGEAQQREYAEVRQEIEAAHKAKDAKRMSAAEAGIDFCAEQFRNELRSLAADYRASWQ